MKIIAFLVVLVISSIFAIRFASGGEPRDLGQKYSEVSYTSAHQKISTEVQSLASDLPISQSLQYSGHKDINVSLTAEEITSYLQSEKWIYTPISQVQVRLNSDGTAEASGILNLGHVLPYISLTTPIDQVKQAIDNFHISGNPPFYIKGKVSVIDNRVNFDIQSLVVGRIPVPADYVSQNLAPVNDFASDRLNSVPNLKVRSLKLADGQVKLDATVPALVQKAQ